MKATLDTNIIMHLYDVGLEEAIFNSFEEVYVYDFIIDPNLFGHPTYTIRIHNHVDISFTNCVQGHKILRDKCRILYLYNIN